MTGFPLTPEPGPTANTANLAMQGKLNSVGSITLTQSSATTTLTDYYLTTESKVFFTPLTANAAAELAAGTMYVLAANKGDGSWTITNANNAQSDRTFDYLIIG